MIALVLLYVGAVLFLNAIWLLGYIQDREIGIMNIFAGGIIFIAAIIMMVIGGFRGDFPSIVFSAQLLLFAFTYLWVAYARYANPDGRGLGWYCLFVALTAAPTAVITLANANGDTWLTWLGANWAAWAVLWFMYWLLLGVQRPIRKIAAYTTLFVGVMTAWVPGYMLMMGYLSLSA